MYIVRGAGDIPDPRPGLLEQVRQMPVPVITFVPQAHLEGALPGAVQSANDQFGLREMSVGFTYTLIRNPVDRGVPENLAELDEATQHALDELPHVHRPAWIVEMSERIRYPQLHEAVRTSWFRENDERATVDVMLLEHVNHVLRNGFQAERGGEGLAGSMPPAPDVVAAAIQRDAQLAVDGAVLNGIRIDTDPFVVGLGARLPSGGILTVVVPRDELAYLTLEFEASDLSS